MKVTAATSESATVAPAMFPSRSLARAAAGVGLLLTLLLVLAPAAGAQDPMAPPGAPKTWLPKYEWVLNHFFPYDGRTLYRVLGTDDQKLRGFYGGQAHEVVPPITDLARLRGISRARLTRILMRPWRGKVSRRRFAALRRRTILTLTQGHVLQHMLFHPLHEKALMEAEPEIFGADHMTLAAMRRQGMTLAQVGEHFGKTEQETTAAAEAVLRRTMHGAVRRQWTLRAPARRYLRFQISAIPAWLHFARGGGRTHVLLGAGLNSRAARGRAAG